MEEWPVLWSARGFVVVYVAWLTVTVLGWGEKSGRASRMLWSLAGVVLVVHILIAFHFAHGWSHDDALRHAARRTVEVTGAEFAAGLYFNYVLLGVWLWLTLRLWRRPAPRVLPLPLSEKILHGIVIFFVYHATAVFGPPFWKLVVGAVAALLSLAWFIQWPRRPRRAVDQSS